MQIKIVNLSFVDQMNNFSAEFHAHPLAEKENLDIVITEDEYKLIGLYLSPSYKTGNTYGVSLSLLNKIQSYTTDIVNGIEPSVKFDRAEKDQMKITCLRLISLFKISLDKDIVKINNKLELLYKLKSNI